MDSGGQVVSLSYSIRVEGVLRSVATLAAVAVLAWVLAYWTTQWFAPAPELRLPGTFASSFGAGSAAGLFGQVQRESVVTDGTIRLLGVMAGSPGSVGYAILRRADQPASVVRLGEELAPGVRLAEVHPDKVVLDRSGVQEVVPLPRKKPTAEPSNTSSRK